MPNVTEIYQLATQSQYMSDGVKQALEGLIHFIPQELKISDNISFYSNDALSTTPVDVDTGSGSYPIVVVVESRGAAGILRLYNQGGSASVTASDELGPDVVVPFATTTGEITTALFSGNSFRAWWAAGLVAVVSASLPGVARTAPATSPRVYMLYRNVA